MRLWRDLWCDESGAVMSAEAVLLGAVVAAGATTGMKMAGDSLNSEIEETAYSIRSLNQSYSFSGHQSCGAWTAGSCYVQPPVEESLKELRALREKEKQIEQKKKEAEKKPEPKKKKKPKQPESDVRFDEESTDPVPFELETTDA